ncbi:MAG: tetratricopeptide repeat protein [Blastocatellia bacterium]|nr:tetratricopeptide repeat protein [Blastocatellia bacterium]
MQRVCANCGLLLEPDSNFCRQCATPTATSGVWSEATTKVMGQEGVKPTPSKLTTTTLPEIAAVQRTVPIEHSSSQSPSDTLRSQKTGLLGRRQKRYFVMATILSVLFVLVLGVGLVLGYIFKDRIFQPARPALATEPEKPIEEEKSTEPVQPPTVKELSDAALNDLASGNLNKALESIEKAIELDPSMPQSYKLKGDILVQSTRYKDATENYAKAIELDQNYLQAYKPLAKAYEQLKQYDKVVEIANKALSKEEDAELRKILNSANQELAKLSSQKNLDKKRELEAKAQQNQVAVKPQPVEESVPETPKVEPPKPEPVRTVEPRVTATQRIENGQKMHNLGDYQGALREYRAALQQQPENQSIHYLIGLSLEKSGDIQGAYDAYSRCQSGTYSSQAQQHVKRLAKKLKK